MSINQIPIANSVCLCSAVDYEALMIARRLMELGIKPTGDKQANKAKLHEMELKIAKSRNEALGGLLTISYAKEQEIIDNKKENLFGNKKAQKKEKNNSDVLKEDEILGRQIYAIIEMKMKEEKDYKKSKKLRNAATKLKNNKKIVRTVGVSETSALPEVKSGQKDLNLKIDIEN